MSTKHTWLATQTNMDREEYLYPIKVLAALTWTWTTQAVLPVPPSPPANEGQVTRGHVEFAFSSSTGTHAPTPSRLHAQIMDLAYEVSSLGLPLALTQNYP